MKLITWNVNGIRSVFRQAFTDWLATEDPDIVCLQETKADEGVMQASFAGLDGYYAHYHSAAKKGYAGVAVYSKVKPLAVETKLGIERFDDEGRCLKLTFENFTLFNFYIPNGGRIKNDMAYKLDVYSKLFPILKSGARAKTILVGDFNIAHTEMDLFRPQQNRNSTMFTPEERKQIDALLKLGYVDTFRAKHPDTKAYTWWPYGYEARERDMGWRIDYVFVSTPLIPHVTQAFTRRDVRGSDHGPAGVVLDIPFTITERPTYEKEPPQTTLF
jgi:exodeoxyribonuclease-3